ncbi:MAG: hypothetical protein ACJA0J_002132 [Bdellovibrionota bacterium]|jgi:hypothetical protein
MVIYATYMLALRRTVLEPPASSMAGLIPVVFGTMFLRHTARQMINHGLATQP